MDGAGGCSILGAVHRLGRFKVRHICGTVESAPGWGWVNSVAVTAPTMSMRKTLVQQLGYWGSHPHNTI